MRFKLLIAFVDDAHTNAVMHAAREAGATGATVITSAQGEGIEKIHLFGTRAGNAARRTFVSGGGAYEPGDPGAHR